MQNYGSRNGLPNYAKQTTKEAKIQYLSLKKPYYEETRKVLFLYYKLILVPQSFSYSDSLTSFRKFSFPDILVEFAPRHVQIKTSLLLAHDLVRQHVYDIHSLILVYLTCTCVKFVGSISEKF